MQSSQCNVLSKHFNPDYKVWEIKVATVCGPRVAVGRDETKTMQLAEREAREPRRPTLVRLI